MRSISVRLVHKWSLVMAVACLCALPALGQDSKGEFTIPKEVHWGPRVLPAGSYSYTVEHHASEVLLIRPKAGGNGYFLMANSVSRPNLPAPNRLLLERRGTDWYVTSMVVDDLGEALMFLAPPATDSATKLATIASE